MYVSIISRCGFMSRPVAEAVVRLLKLHASPNAETHGMVSSLPTMNSSS